MKPDPDHYISILAGPTASGKSALALERAHQSQGSTPIEIISADSLVVYRELNIGTAKPETSEIPHHLVDIREPNEAFTIGDFLREAEKAIANIRSRGKKPLIVGGTFFYVKALLFGLWDAPAADPELRAELDKKSNAELHNDLQKIDPERAQKIGANDRYRLVRANEVFLQTGQAPSSLESQKQKPPDSRFKLELLLPEWPLLEARITARTQAMLQAGLVAETKRLFERYGPIRPLQSVGYRQTIDFLEGRPPVGRKIRSGLPGLEDEINLATRQLAKQQITWIRSLKERLKLAPLSGMKGSTRF